MYWNDVISTVMVGVEGGSWIGHTSTVIRAGDTSLGNKQVAENNGT